MMRTIIRRHGASLVIYFGIAFASALVEWTTFWLLLKLAPPHYLIAAVVAFVVATIVNYLLCIRTIFASKTSSVWNDIARIFVASGLAFLVNLLVLAILVSRFELSPMLAKIAGTGVAFLFNFTSRQFVIFAPSQWLESEGDGWPGVALRFLRRSPREP
jgi:putative flippase GtrA